MNRTIHFILFLLFTFSLLNINSNEQEFSSYHVYVNRLAGAEELIEDLRNQDLIALLYEPEFPGMDSAVPTPENNQSIWLGCYVPFNIAMITIKTNYTHFPFLKYIYINEFGCPEEVKYEIFIGGSTETAESYGLSPITADDFREASQSFKDIEDLHMFIKSHYSLDDIVL